MVVFTLSFELNLVLMDFFNEMELVLQTKFSRKDCGLIFFQVFCRFGIFGGILMFFPSQFYITSRNKYPLPYDTW